MSTTLIVVRHCQTKLNAEKRIQGSNYDLQLTSVGILQAFFMAEKLNYMLNGKKVDVIIASPTKRAVETAQSVGSLENIITDKRLLPYNVGSADGMKEEDLHTIKRFPNPIFYRRMENFMAYIKRLKRVLKDILIEHQNKTIVVVTHEDVSAMFEKLLMKNKYFNVPNLGLKNGEFRIYNINSYSKEDVLNNLQINKIESRDFAIEKQNQDDAMVL